jgi:putative oxygen-independent coproporphyrinogen III oxidase
VTSLDRALGLYIHWPYCARICPYCDFNVYRPRGGEDVLFDAMLADMAIWRVRTGPRPLVSIHFGGGTPSLLRSAQIEALIDRADQLWGLEEGVEIGLEANPKDLDLFGDFASAGINRLSLGVQSFDDSTLVTLGRDHDAMLGRRAVVLAGRVFSNLSLDLIYAHHGQTLAQWTAELTEALNSGVGHLSPYQLTIESGTAFGKRVARGEALTTPPDRAADFFEATQTICESMGFPAYEISNHARSLSDQSVHNTLYWAGGDWIGLGPGAHGRLGRSVTGGRKAYSGVLRPDDYREAISLRQTGIALTEDLSADDEAAERILMGLRLVSGLDRRVLRAATGLDVDTSAMEQLCEDGLITAQGDLIALTRRGRLLADGVSGALVVA